MKEITQVAASPGPLVQGKTSAGEGGNGFVEFLEKAVDGVNQAQLESDRAIAQLNTGQAKNLHEVMIAMEEADISMRLMVQMRNKVVEAYQEIMRMQV